MLSQELIAILACPKCKGDLEHKYSDETKEEFLVCNSCCLQFEVKDGIPNLLIDEAKSL